MSSISPWPSQQPLNVNASQFMPPPGYQNTGVVPPWLRQPDFKSNITPFESISLRLWGHDIQDEGKNNGSVFLKTLLNPEGSQNQPFWKTPEALQTTWIQYQNDLRDDGVINGSSLRQNLANVYWKVTGHDISQQLAQAPYQRAPISYNEIFKTAPDMMTPEGLKQTTINTGLSTNQLLNTALWGHDARDLPALYGRTLDGSVLEPSLNDPKSIDYGFVNSSPGTKNYVRDLIRRDQRQSGQITGQSLNADFLAILNKIYGTPGAFTGA